MLQLTQLDLVGVVYHIVTQRQGTHCVRVLAVLERVQELLDYRTPWQRALWSVGTMLELREILDYAQHPQNDPRGGYAINSDTINRLVKDAGRRVSEDVGIGDDNFRKRVSNLLNGSKLSGEDWYRLQYFVEQAERGYLKRWANAASSQMVSEERIARHLAETLLDKGVSPDKIHMWATRRLKESPSDFEGNDLRLDAIRTGELIIDAERLVKEKEVGYQVGIPFRKCSLDASSLPLGASYFTPQQARAWLDRECSGWNPKSAGVDAWSAFLVIGVKCWDEWAAVDRAGELIARMEARISLAPKRSRFEPIPRAWVPGIADSFKLFNARREVCVPFLDQDGVIGHIENDSTLSPVADALVLLASMKSSTAGASLSGGWAAMEGLLGEDEKYLVARRMASILAAALPRAELTSLVHVDVLPEKLRRQLTDSMPVSRKIGILEQRIREEYKHLDFENMTDRLAITRLKELMIKPFPTLEGVRTRIEGTFSRLNRQRNIIMHDGRLDSIATSATLRIAPALVAAGLDRILVGSSPGHASGSKAPLQLAALAHERLQDLRNVRSPRLAKLLD